MSSCDLAVLFDREERTYQPGETISGEVQAKVNEDVSCKALRIELCWQTHGRGNTDSESVDTIVQPDLAWRSGMTYTYPFSFKAPKKPLTYHGHYLNIDHYVKARVDLPWKIDPKASEEVILIPGKTSGDDYRADSAEEEEKQAKTTSRGLKILGWILAPIFIVMLVALLFFLWYVFVLVVVVALGIKLKQYYANKRLGNVVVDTGSSRISPEDAIPVKLCFSPAKAVAVTNASATLTGKEICVSGSGTNKTTHRHTLCEEKIILASEYRAPGGGIPVEFTREIPMPETSAYTFKASDNAIEWELAVHIDIPKFPDWKKKLPLTVVPKNSP